jgi:Polysaccharide biosynthesis C-terminal domain
VLRITGRGPVEFWRLPRRATVARVGGYARSVFAIDASYTLSSSLSVVFLGAYVGSAASGMFQAPAKLITLIQYVGLSTANGVAPRLTRGPGQEPNVRALHGALRGLIGFQCLMLAPAVVWAKPITRLLLGPGYSGSADVLTALAPYIFFSGLAPLVTMGVNYLGEARRRIPISLATLAITAAGGVVLIPRHGVVGAAIATDIAFGFYTLAHIWLCRRLFELRIGMLVWSLACGLTAAVAMGIVLESFGTGHLTLFELLRGGAAGTATYVAMLIFTREIRRDHVVHLAAAVRARLNVPRAAGPSEPAEATSFPATVADDAFWEESADAVPIIPSPGASIEPVASGSERPAAVAPQVAAPDEPRKRVWSVLGLRRRAAAPPPAAPATAAVAPEVLDDPRSPAASPPEWVEGMLSEPGLLLAGSGGRSSPRSDSRYAGQADVPPTAVEPPREPGATGDDAASAAPPALEGRSGGLRPDDLHDADAGRRAAAGPLSVAGAFGSDHAHRPTNSILEADALYEIVWRPAKDAGLFELRLADVIEDDVEPGTATSAVDQSPPVPWAWRMPPAPIPEARRAHQTLVVRLLDEGWRRAGSGDIWFAHRFRPPAGVGAHSTPAGARADELR